MDDGTNPASVASGPNSDLSQQSAGSRSMRSQLVTLNSITTFTTLCTEIVSEKAITQDKVMEHSSLVTQMCFHPKVHTIIHRVQQSWQRVPETWSGKSKCQAPAGILLIDIDSN